MNAALGLDSPLSALVRLGPLDLQRLKRLSVLTVQDLLLCMPYGVEQYGQPLAVDELKAGSLATVIGSLEWVHARHAPWRRGGRTEALLVDDRGTGLRLVWFNRPYLARTLAAGDRVVVAGKVAASRYPPGREMVNPQQEPMPTLSAPRLGGLRPRYHLTAGLTQAKLEGWIGQVLPLADQVPDSLPEEVRARRSLVSIGEAIGAGHKPADEAAWAAARRRMAFTDLFELQAGFLLAKGRLVRERATPIPYVQGVIDTLKGHLGFDLTKAQRRCIWEIFQDLEQARPMNRLLNGDVGSGKTAVAAAAVAMTHAANLQSIVMAPTDILARQHLLKFRHDLEPAFADLKVELLVSRQGAAERRRVLAAAASNQCGLLVGTHAVIEESVQMASLGLVIVDEQHRFGTSQRELLRTKSGSSHPHFLAMTATPIPRSLALALYGEMELSIMDEMPPGRAPVETRVRLGEARAEAYELIRREVALGHQAFIICPLVEESEALAVKAATAEFDRLRQDVFPDLRLALVHGRMRDKDRVMEDFRSGLADVLVATPVIEVGVDVPNATVMVVEGADHFGLAQLHQFRGRVGRGSAPAHCLLLADEAGVRGLDRLDLMTRIYDGFELAREDMRLRGAGQLMGARQHGVSDAAMDALLSPELLNEARLEAELLARQDPSFERWPELRAAIARRTERMSIS
ncbi:MAG: ATP-dependent DNA helicase RecG [Candidatus Dormibacteraceae bacterium]